MDSLVSISRFKDFPSSVASFKPRALLRYSLDCLLIYCVLLGFTFIAYFFSISCSFRIFFSFDCYLSYSRTTSSQFSFHRLLVSQLLLEFSFVGLSQSVFRTVGVLFLSTVTLVLHVFSLLSFIWLAILVPHALLGFYFFWLC